MADLLTALLDRLGASLDHNGRAHADCPFCGADGFSRTGRAAYHFYVYDLPGRQGACCQVCGWRGSYRDLADHFDLHGYAPPAPREQIPVAPAPWTHPGALAHYRAFQRRQWPAVARAWQAYKPLDELTIETADLGLGRLPMWSERKRAWYMHRFDRLIVPLIADGQLVGLRGRAIDPADDGPKWLTASTSTSVLMGLDAVTPGSIVVWCENLVDRLLAAASDPRAVYVASGGVSWQVDWLDQLIARSPRAILIFFDNDLAGCPSDQAYTQGHREWLSTMQDRLAQGKISAIPHAPEPRGPKLANELLKRRDAAGKQIAIRVHRWPSNRPLHWDLGSEVSTSARLEAA